METVVFINEKIGLNEIANVLADTAYPVGRQDRHFVFLMLVSIRFSLIKKG